MTERTHQKIQTYVRIIQCVNNLFFKIKFMIFQTQEVGEKFPDLVILIQNTESMDDTERKYWFWLLNGNVHNDTECMTDEQANRLYEILNTEKIKLNALEERYWREIEGLNSHHIEMRKNKLKFITKKN